MKFFPNFIMKRPRVAEYDFAGTVVNSNGTSFNPGDKVWGFLNSAGLNGALAQYITVTEEEAALRPENLSLEQAAGLGCVGMTAQQSIYKIANVQPGQCVLVVGGGSDPDFSLIVY